MLPELKNYFVILSFLIVKQYRYREETNILIHRQKEKQSLRTNLFPPVQCARFF